MRRILLLLIFISGKSFAQQPAIASKLQHALLQGIPDSVYEGYHEVFENRTTNSGRKIKLYIEGGPGVAATKNASWLVDKKMPYRQNDDVVLVDAR
jgi:hypothetical protein